MNKKIIIVLVGVVVVLGIAGAVFFFTNTASNGSARNQLSEIPRGGNQTGGRQFSASTTPASIEDLRVGEEITVIGTSNADGSMAAETILIGTVVFEPGQFGSGRETGGQGSSDRQPPEGFTPPEGFNPEGGSAGGGQGGMPGRGARTQGGQGLGGGNMVRGEILAIDDITITIALPDGGSRLVLYSSQTTIAKASESEM